MYYGFNLNLAEQAENLTSAFIIILIFYAQVFVIHICNKYLACL